MSSRPPVKKRVRYAPSSVGGETGTLEGLPAATVVAAAAEAATDSVVRVSVAEATFADASPANVLATERVTTDIAMTQIAVMETACAEIAPTDTSATETVATGPVLLEIAAMETATTAAALAETVAADAAVSQTMTAEVAAAAVPPEDDFERDEMSDNDSDEAWGSGHGHGGAFEGRTLYIDENVDGEDNGDVDEVGGDVLKDGNVGSGADVSGALQDSAVHDVQHQSAGADSHLTPQSGSHVVSRSMPLARPLSDPYALSTALVSSTELLASEAIPSTHPPVVDHRHIHPSPLTAASASVFPAVLSQSLVDVYARAAVDGDRHVLEGPPAGPMSSLFHDVGLHGGVDGAAAVAHGFDDFERDELETSSDEEDAQSAGEEFLDDDLLDDDDEEDDEDADFSVANVGTPSLRIHDTVDDGADDLRGGASRGDHDNDGRLGEQRNPPSGLLNDGGEDYANFLQAILADDAQSSTALPAAIASFLDDDDADFDYLTAVAQTKEDPLEYRNDKAVHVSRREIVDLVGGQPGRRRRLRRSGQSVGAGRDASGKAAVAAVMSIPAPAPLAPAVISPSFVRTDLPATSLATMMAPAAMVAPLPLVQSEPSSIAQTTDAQFPVPVMPQIPQPAPPRAPPQFPALYTQHMALQTGERSVLGVGQFPTAPMLVPPALNGKALAAAPMVANPGSFYPVFPQHAFAQPAPVFPNPIVPAPVCPQVAPPLAPRPSAADSDHVFWPAMIGLLQHQLSSLVVLLAHVHAKANCDEARSQTRSLLLELLAMRDLSRQYKLTFEPRRREREDPMYCGAGQQPDPETHLATPALDIVKQFLEDAASNKESPGILLARFREFVDFNLLAALEAPTVRKKLSLSTEAEALDWTVEDDQLLAMTIAKHTIDFGESSKDLLPHRDTADCQRRMRYLSSRRCRDNPVKQQVHAMTANVQPLSRMEVDVIKQGLAKFAPNTAAQASLERPGPEVWKAIQRDMLPHRDWRQLDKVWSWREAKKRYKLNSRLRKKG